MNIQGDDVMDVWKQAVKAIYEQGLDGEDRNDRQTKEIINQLITITDCRQVTQPIEFLSRNKKWVYPTLKEIEEIILVRKAMQSYEYSYGTRLFGTDSGHDQINDYVIPLLKQRPDSRRAVAMVMQPGDGMPEKNRQMPSVISIDFMVRNGALHATMVIRSNDVFIGWPANIYQLYVLADFVASRLDLPIGSISTVAHSAHIFTDYADDIKSLLHLK